MPGLECSKNIIEGVVLADDDNNMLNRRRGRVVPISIWPGGRRRGHLEQHTGERYNQGDRS